VRFFILALSSNAGLGYSPRAPGTFGTLAGIPVFYLLAAMPPGLFALTLLALFFLACWAAGEAGRIYGVVDDSRIVIDELVGYLVTVAFLPFSWTTAWLAFAWFRLFDISKLQPAAWFDRNCKNGYGVVLDDVVAGVYGAIALRLTLYVWHLFVEA